MRTYLIPISCIPPIVGACIIWKGSWAHRGLPLFGYYLLPTFGTPYVLTQVPQRVGDIGDDD